MKRITQTILLIIVFNFLLFNSDCNAKIRGGALEGGISLGAVIVDDDNSSDNEFLGRLDLGYNITDHIGLELSLGNTFNSLEKVPDITLYNISSVFNLSPNYIAVPYFTFGFGAANFITDTRNNESMFNISFGVGAKYFLNDDLALKLDVRDYMTTSGMTHNVTLTFGFVYLYDLFAPEAARIFKEEPEEEPQPEVIEEIKEPEPVEDEKVDIEIVPQEEPVIEIEPVEEEPEEMPEEEEPEEEPVEKPVKKRKKIEEENEWWR
jgi:OOP family OmpA-OmpF porin